MAREKEQSQETGQGFFNYAQNAMSKFTHCVRKVKEMFLRS